MWLAPAVNLHVLYLTCITGLHCHISMVRPYNHRSAHLQPGLLKLLVHLQLALALVAGSGPHHYVCVCNWSLPLYKHCHRQICARHQFLPWYLTAGPGGTTENLNSPWSHCKPPTTLTKNHPVVNVDSNSPSWWDNMTSEPRATTWPYTWHSATLYLGPQHILMCPHKQVKFFPY